MKLRFLIALALFAGFSITQSFAQTRNCTTMEYLEQQEEANPKRALKLRQIDQHAHEAEGQSSRVDGTITIPVVVHVVYNNSTENVSDAQIQSQIDVLNEDFRRLNADASNTPSVFQGVAADSEIEFCLASVDPSGNATNGITRTSTTRTSFGTNDQVKFNSSGGKDAWPAGDYLNMWVCDISGSILGYAQFPGGSPSTDGVVIDYAYFGTIGTATSPFDLGRTATHEVGHWLNLRHIWGDGGCSVDDFVSDTPTAGSANTTGSPCSFPGPNTCNSGSGDLPDMFQNYMDYSDDVCMNLFTQGQKSRMRALFDPGGFRVSLLNSNGCGNGTPPTCDDGIQNGDETGVDCGGSVCAPCPCNDVDLTLTIVLDNYPEETSWTVTNSSGSTVASGGTYGSQPDGSTVVENISLADGDYTFTIFDSYGDGICCSYGSGSYTLADDSGVIASGGQFGSSEATSFCASGDTSGPTCDDGIQNGQETGVDCGGPDCPACPPTCDDGIQNGQETGVDCGGPDCPACPPTCDDGIQNGQETGVDCGGPDCPACPPTCDDGIQNGQETGVDCGGPDCPACPPTCDDGIQNGQETGVDCGGPDCAPCSTCSDGQLTLTINLDNYPEETSWTVTTTGGSTVASGGTYGAQPDGSTVVENISLADGDYVFTIFDAYGDGICCGYGSGSYSLTDASGVIASGGQFGSSDATAFCVSGATGPTCSDGIQNGQETGVDCGGPDCDPCNPGGCSNVIVNFNDFEGGWGIWNDGGSDCRRSSGDAAYAIGTYCVRLRDNTSSSTMTTDNLNLSAYDELTIDFSYYPRSMDNSNEDFWLQISTNGGASYTTVEEWNLNDEFVNDQRYFDNVVISGPFSSSTRLRFRCDASGNSDYVYIDEVEIVGCLNSTRTSDEVFSDMAEDQDVETHRANTGLSSADMKVFPNPTSDQLTVAFTLPQAGEVQLFVTDMNGKQVSQQKLEVEGTATKHKTTVDASQMAPGVYFVHLVTDSGHISQKFIVIE